MEKIKIKSVLSKLVLTICLLLLISFPASAIDLNNNNQMLYDSYKDRHVQAAIIIEDGIPRRLTQSEYDEILSKREKMSKIKDSISIKDKQLSLQNFESNEIQPQSYWVEYSFDKWGEDHWYPSSMTRRVSPITRARDIDTDMGYTDSVGISVSIGGSFGASAEIKRIITAEFTIDYSNSTEYTKSYYIGGVVPKGSRGWVEFTPLVANIWGKLTKTEWSNYKEIVTESYSDSFFPTRIGSFADGIYEIIIEEGLY